MQKIIIIRTTLLIGFIVGIIVLMSSKQFTIKNVRISVYSSSTDGDRLTRQSDLLFKTNQEFAIPVITINEDNTLQKIDGFGATFNEAGMICLNSLATEEKEKVLQSLFSTESGAGYSLMKSIVGACDFSSAGPWYSYNETPGDTAMEFFSIKRDLEPNGLVPFIKSAMKFGKFEIEAPMDFASDWMYNGLKKGEKQIKPEYYGALATYYSKYVQAYAKNGISINYLNLFNEPGNYSNITYKVMGDLIKNDVVPRFRADGLSTKIQLGEALSRPQALNKFPEVLNDPEVRKHISTITVHGYDWNQFSCLTELHNKFPDIPIWMTEVCYATFCCVPPGGPSKSPVYEFSDGEFWGNMIVNDMKNWVSGWIYWNMILDQEGGPWLTSPEHGDPDPNQQHPVVIIDRNSKEVTYTGLYYYLAHFSKFVRPGGYRINTIGGNDRLNFVGFKNSDNSIVLNVVNNGNATECKVSWLGKMAIAQFKAHSITTLVWNTTKKNKL